MEFRYRLKKKQTNNEGESDQNDPSSIVEKSTADATAIHSSSESEAEHNNNSNNHNLSTMPPVSKRSDWRKDKNNICVLLFLYLLQGVPLGMAASIPLIIQTLKLLWAPLVDALYVKRFGRRKSWLIPIQYLIGIVMITLSYYINDILLTAKSTADDQPHIYFLTSIFFGLSFLAATQDICVDGWAISMLARENVGWASTCNSVGQTAGYFLGNVVFLALESKDFANRYIRQPLHMQLQPNGLITLPDFLLFWGIIFTISTTFVALLKHENDRSCPANEPHFGLVETYKVLLKVLRLPAVRSMALILLTVKIGFAATDAMTALELIERGVAKDSLALLAIPLTPLQILLPFLIAKYTTGSKPLNVYIKSYPFRLLIGLFMAIFVYFTPIFQNRDKTFPWYYYALAVFIYSIDQIFVYSMFVSQMAFFAQVSDPKIGGTYMTLLNTLANLGSNWISTGVLYSADHITWKSCSLSKHRCGTAAEEKTCVASGGVCSSFIDAYYIEVLLCTVVGILWLFWRYRTMKHLQSLPIGAWQVRSTRRRSPSFDEDDDSHRRLSMSA